MESTPAWRTWKFWGVVTLTNIGLLLASGVVVGGTLAQAIGWVTTVLAALGIEGWKPVPKALPPGE